MSVCMTPAGVKYVSQEFQCMTPAGVKYFNYDSGGVKYVNMSDSCRSQAFQCMTPAGVKYFNMYDSCRSQVCQYA